jgi:hypothetical protein
MRAIPINCDQFGRRQTRPSRVLETESLAHSNVRFPFDPFLVHEAAQNEAVSSGSALDLDGVKKRRRSSG